MRGVAANSVAFNGAIFRNADLRGAACATNGVTNLKHSGFHGADLSSAIFDSNTDLTNASLRQADLSFAIDFDLAVLERTEFDASTKFPDGNDWKTTSFFSTDLRKMKINLDNEDISNQDFSPSVDSRYNDFSYGSFLRENATGATFHGNNLADALSPSYQRSSLVPL